VTHIDPADLTGFRFFLGMAPESVERFANAGSDVGFAAGEMIFREGDDATAAYMIRSGDAALEQHIPGQGRHVIQTVHRGEVVGWSWLFAPHRCRFDARAITAIDAVRFDGAAMRDAIAADPAFAAVVYERWGKLLVGRLESARLQLVDIYAQRD
jgi:CRP/FNR family cyclic AMP-dependent transcriptional regulator